VVAVVVELVSRRTLVAAAVMVVVVMVVAERSSQPCPCGARLWRGDFNLKTWCRNAGRCTHGCRIAKSGEGANTRDRSWGPALISAVRELTAMQTLTSVRIVALAVVFGVGAADTSVGGHWALTFEDEFDGITVNRTQWSVANGGAHGANELELYIAEDVWVANGALSIRTRYNPTSCVVPNASRTPGPSDGHSWCVPTNDTHAPGTHQHFNFTSGWLDTEAHFSQRYGRFAVRAKLPDVLAPNVWPAHWLLPDQTSPGCIGTLGQCISPQFVQPMHATS
jgi:hypothetical protein